MTLITKISYLTSSQKITGNWLNAVQNAQRFDGEVRSNIDEVPTNFDEATWAVNQRDPLLDWEVNQDGSLGNLAWAGRILNSDGVSYGKATSFVQNESYFIWVQGGRFLSQDRTPGEWITQTVQIAPGAKQYVWLDTVTSTVQASSAEPPVGSVPLALLAVEDDGVIEEYIDIRPSSFTVDFSNRTSSLIFSGGIQDADYVLEDWERVLVDTNAGSIYVDLPLSPADNAQVSIVDSEGYFHLYPVFLRPAPGGNNTNSTTINGINNDAFALTKRYGVYTLVYSQEKAGWYFIDNQESNDFVRGTFISCGGRQIQPEGTTCTSGSIPSEYLGETDPPVYELIGNRCYLVYPATSAFYSNPSLTDTDGIKAEHMASRCMEDNHQYITGGNSGFSNEELVTRINNANLILAEWELSIRDAFTVVPAGEVEILFDFLNRISYSIRSGFWNLTTEFNEDVVLIVSVSTYTAFHGAVRALLSAQIVTEFDFNTITPEPPVINF